MTDPAKQIDCEFTLALNNRTGKYFFCKDMIDASKDLIRTCYFWRVPQQSLPSRSVARILGRLARIEVDMRLYRPLSYKMVPAIFNPHPMIFTDPRECVLYSLKPFDVVLCHDLGPVKYPEFYAEGVKQLYTLAFARIKAAKPLMLFVSEASRDDFVELYGEDFPLLRVIHIPLRQGMDRSDEQLLSGIPEKFLLTVGSLGSRKNQARSIKAFEASGLAREGYGYVICGGPEPGAEEVAAAAKATPGVIMPGYVNDRELKWLYKSAKGFVLPSLLEGFGLPAAEAISYGQVPLLSAGGALQEVAGEGAVYVDPHDINGIAEAMCAIANMSDSERLNRLAKLSLNIKRFSLEAAVTGWRSALILAAQAHQAARSTR
jgi:glycosyltransferase involved in cell wall biosynthesis